MICNSHIYCIIIVTTLRCPQQFLQIIFLLFRSWNSIVRTRKLHLNVSNFIQNKGMGFISQQQLAITTFGFMG